MDGGVDFDTALLTPEEAKALETLKILNPIISLSAERLEGLRTQCATNAEITHQEIRTLEVKKRDSRSVFWVLTVVLGFCRESW